MSDVGTYVQSIDLGRAILVALALGIIATLIGTFLLAATEEMLLDIPIVGGWVARSVLARRRWLASGEWHCDTCRSLNTAAATACYKGCGPRPDLRPAEGAGESATGLAAPALAALATDPAVATDPTVATDPAEAVSEPGTIGVMTARFVAVPGGRLHVLDDGAGPAILLIHAGIVNARAWDPLVPPLVAAGFRAIRYDTRGYGLTETDDVDFSNRRDAIAVLDELEVERACIVGNSRGGHIAVDTAVEFPERVAALVTIGAGVGGFEPEPTPEEAAIWAQMDALEAGDDPAATADFDVRVWVDGPGQPETRVPTALRETVRAMDLDVASRPPVGRPIPLEPKAAEQIDRLTMPVLAIAGALDVADVATTAQYLADVCPNARAVIVPDVAHLVAMEAPERTAELIVDFLRPLGAYA